MSTVTMRAKGNDAVSQQKLGQGMAYAAAVLLLGVVSALPAVLVGLLPWIAGMSTLLRPLGAVVVSVVIYWVAYAVESPVEGIVRAYSGHKFLGTIVSAAIALCIYCVGYSMISGSFSYALLQAIIVHLVYVLLWRWVRSRHKGTDRRRVTPPADSGDRPSEGFPSGT